MEDLGRSWKESNKVRFTPIRYLQDINCKVYCLESVKLLSGFNVINLLIVCLSDL